MKVYTKTGDNGITSLYDGSRIAKSEQIFDVLGTLDELAAHIGVLCCKYRLVYKKLGYINEFHSETFLVYIQKTLLNIGSIIATPSGGKTLPEITEEDVNNIETVIDKIDKYLPELTTFLIMDGPTEISAIAHVCRTVCRRVEREMERYGNIDRTITKFINRLSDYFFMVSRYNSQPIFDF